MTIELSTDHDRMDLETIWRLVSGTYWAKGIRREILEAAVRNSIVVGAFDLTTGGQVGFARAVSDRATFAWLCDVIVDERFRKRGVATQMVRTLMAHPELQTLRRWALATRDAHGVYEPLGFTAVEPGRWMERKLDRSVWAEREND